MNNTISNTILILLSFSHLSGQHISEFISLEPAVQDAKFHIPSSHTFQYILEENDPLDDGNLAGNNLDFAGYVPIGGSSENGYLSVNFETSPGGVAVLDVSFDPTLKAWITDNSAKIDFTSVAGTARNCSGAITPWGTVLSCEEAINTNDNNNDGFHDLGWVVEIDPVNKVVIDKRWGMGKMKHENAAIHPNQSVFYLGADSNPGYLYKFVADLPSDLSSGELFVYIGDKVSGGIWESLGKFPSANYDANATLSESMTLGATVFNGVEDVEYNPKDDYIYFAVKNESSVYRFQDPNPLTGLNVINFETYVGGSSTTSYPIDFGTGIVQENWGIGNDNLAIDNLGNLWVFQDGSNDYIWFVEDGHTQSNPKVKIFGRSPTGSEPTGVTFTPDHKFMFMSLQHPAASNAGVSQLDAFQNPQTFSKDVTIVIARKEHLGNCHPNLVLNGQPIVNESYGAQQSITSGGLINNQSQIDYTAGNCILLTSNFNVNLGAQFTAQIQNCIPVTP